jgi:CheY-like chemotaxis protein
LEIKPDVILLDIKIPVLQGYDVCRHLKTRADMRGVKVIMMSGYMAPPDEERARHYGAHDILRKPLEIDEMLDKVSGMVPPPDPDLPKGEEARADGRGA